MELNIISNIKGESNESIDYCCMLTINYNYVCLVSSLQSVLLRDLRGGFAL